MAILGGSKLPPQLYADFTGLSIRLKDGVEQWRMPYKVQVTSPPKDFGPKTHSPGEELKRVIGGTRYPGFVVDYYNRIHILPGSISLGSVLGTQTRSVEVWNSYFESRDFQALDVSNPSGTTLTPLAGTAPTTMLALKSLLYTLTVSVAGPPTVNANYRFRFDVGDYFLPVVGQRTAIFAFPPNWRESVIERYSWLTNVLTTMNGKEQRIARRLTPRRTFEYTIAQFTDRFQLLDSLLVGWQSRTFAFPVWPDAQRLPYSPQAGQIEIDCNTEGRDFYVGGYAILTTDPRRTEAVQIEEVTPTKVVLGKPLDRTWPVRTVFAPARLGRLNSEVDATRPAAKLGEMRVLFDIDDISDVPPQPDSLTYLGTELCLRRPNRAVDATAKYRRIVNKIDFDEGVISIEDTANRSFVTRSFEFLLRDRAWMADFRGWLHARQGQLKPFWMPAWESNIDIAQPSGSTSSSFIVQSAGMASYLEIDDSRRHVAMLHTNGTWYFRRVLQFGPGATEDEEIMYLESSLGVATSPGDFQLVTFLDYVVLNSDDIELSYLKSEAATVRLATRSVIQ